MSPNYWPWSAEEATEWEQELRQQEFGWMDELIDQMVSDGLGGSGYDPLEQEWDDEEVVAP